MKLIDFQGAIAEQEHFGLRAGVAVGKRRHRGRTRRLGSGDPRAVGVARRRRPRRVDGGRHVYRQRFLDDDRSRSLHGFEFAFFEHLGLIAGLVFGLRTLLAYGTRMIAPAQSRSLRLP